MAASAPAFKQAFSTQRICLLIGFLICSTIAGPGIGADLRCPDYVIQHGKSVRYSMLAYYLGKLWLAFEFERDLI